MNEAVLIYPHQLFDEYPGLIAGRTVYLIEDPLYFSQYKFHKQKLVLHRASMKAYEAMLIQKGYRVVYIDHAKAGTRDVLALLKANNITNIYVVDVVDNWLEKKVIQIAQEVGLVITWLESPQFLTSKKDVEEYWNSTNRHLQHSFYVWQRKRLGILVEHGKPVGGTWSLDKENRKSLPKEIVLPTPYVFEDSSFVREAKEYVEAHFSDHYGDTATFMYATTHTEARKCMHTFLKERLMEFGAYEDAMSTTDHTLFHSVLSPYLNNGLLTAREVLTLLIDYTTKHTVPLASLEGFVRQLIGWREYMRMVYVCDGTRMRNQNALKSTRMLTTAWWDGTTGIVPIDHAIETLKAYAYTHHIVRLMVLGNMMSLLGVDPHEAHRWFMQWYIDAYDWVMVPNVYGMTLFADGGTIVTKPYISSSRYILKMSNYPKEAWAEAWDALYWAYVNTHRRVLSQNIRAGFSVRLYDRFSKEKQHILQSKANELYDMLTT